MSEANDTFIGRLFHRIMPGSSYAAFPWRSWDKICTILETIRGRGCRIKRSPNETQWEIDATSGVYDKPDAYSVFVHDVKKTTEEGEEGQDPTTEVEGMDDDDLPNIMKEDEEPTVYCYVPFNVDEHGESGDEGIHISGANGPDQAGDFGAMAEEEWPEHSHWGWMRVGILDGSDNVMVVYGTIVSPGTGSHGTGPEFTDITMATEKDFETAARASTDGSVIVPIAWISGTNVVQTLCGRPWVGGGGGGGGECVLASVSDYRYDTGVFIARIWDWRGGTSASYQEVSVICPNINGMTRLNPGDVVILHKCQMELYEGEENDGE